MKKKLDFVTNSSSCAFIFIGWVLDTGDKVKEIVKEQMEIYGTTEYDPDLSPTENLYEVYNGEVDITLGDEENGLPADKVCIGIKDRIHDDDYEIHEYSVQDVIDVDEKLSENFDPGNIKIISGMEMC